MRLVAAGVLVLLGFGLGACSSGDANSGGLGGAAAGGSAGSSSGGESSSAGKSASGGAASGGVAGGASGSGVGGQSVGGGQAGEPTTTAGATNGGDSAGGNGGSGGAAPIDAAAVIRVQVNYDTKSKQYALGTVARERSGTEALQLRAKKRDPLGSFTGTVVDPKTGTTLFQQTIGTGYYYRELARALSFRFPNVTTPFIFRMTAEDATTGAQQQVVEKNIDPATVSELPSQTVEVKPIKAALTSPKLIMPFYAEGYLAARKDNFFQDAKKVADTLVAAHFPAIDSFEIVAVWLPSNKTLGELGASGVVPKQDTALGLSFPVWSDISGAELIIYPTDESKLRGAFGQVPYDYPVVVVDDDRYWGVGNYNMYTAVPARSSSLRLLINHEMGHFFGLNEEYNGQDTELAFGAGTTEPWSQNITFQTTKSQIKWADLIASDVAIPTPEATWSNAGKIGAYRGGYPNDARSMTPVPDGVCLMSSGKDFCAVCKRAIESKARFDSDDLPP